MTAPTLALATVTACVSKAGDAGSPMDAHPDGTYDSGLHSDTDAGPDSDTDRVGDSDVDTLLDTGSDTAVDTAMDTAADAAGDFVKVRASTFLMGCTAGQKECYPQETEHGVTLTHTYYVGVNEVTQGQFLTLMGYNPAYFTDCNGHGPDDCPVERVSWYESAAYANALSDAAGLTSCYACIGSGSGVECEAAMNPYDCEGYRLLTEAEWEGAARCGTDLLYAGSDDSLAVAWTSENSSGAQTVAGLASNACGVHDMSGNLWEWTHDWEGDYDPGPVTDPVGPESGTDRIYRGGDWGDPALSAARVAYRIGLAPQVSTHSLGFRLARTAPGG